MMNSKDILASVQTTVPRYTSYPTAPHFRAEEGQALAREMISGVKPGERISLYLHVPYCDRLCWFCGCHTKHTLKYEPVERYINALATEIDQTGAAIGNRPDAGFIHFGGGSPSMLKSGDMARLADRLHASFNIDGNTETSIEIDPSDALDLTFEGLRHLGVTRASIGVQDFDPVVQKAINRPQGYEQTRDVIGALRAAGVRSLNIDALYGLPLQTESRLADTIEKVISLKPDRVALFGYAHVPWMKKHQTMIRDEDLPGQVERFEHAQLAAEMLVSAGYLRIGIDHFALPQDSLALAAANGTLRRNFQGYTTDNCPTMIGLGASSISRFPGGHVQNIVATGQYEAAVFAGESTASKGSRFSRDDIIRGAMIEQIMCYLRLDFDWLESCFGPSARPYVAEARLAAATDTFGLCRVEENSLVIPEQARPFARIVASKFDAYLGEGQARYSKAV